VHSCSPKVVTAIIYSVVSCVVLHGDQHLSVSLSAVTAVGIWPDQAREECQDDHPDPNGVNILFVSRGLLWL
jgi:hypothetical protein